jgi:hypothetical protein
MTSLDGVKLNRIDWEQVLLRLFTHVHDEPQVRTRGEEGAVAAQSTTTSLLAFEVL